MKQYETVSPDVQNIALKSIAVSMRFLRDFDKIEAQAAGADKRAITKIIPTTLISATMLSAVKIKSKYSSRFTLMPFIFEKSESNKNAFQSLKNAIAVKTTITVSISIVKISFLVTDKILPKR